MQHNIRERKRVCNTGKRNDVCYNTFGSAVDHLKRVETDKSASRFFYCAKVSKKERGEGNNHVTVKPIALMKYLITLITPVGGTVLDPFMGSGSTFVPCRELRLNGIGIESDRESYDIAKKRIKEG